MRMIIDEKKNYLELIKLIFPDIKDEKYLNRMILNNGGCLKKNKYYLELMKLMFPDIKDEGFLCRIIIIPYKFVKKQTLWG
jgi:hypothetical protein